MIINNKFIQPGAKRPDAHIVFNVGYLTPECNNRYKWCTDAMLTRHLGVR
jgi:hypothetical protein